MKICKLADLKRALQTGAVIRTIGHQKPELIGLARQVTKVQTNAVYTVVVGQPDHKYSRCNNGKGCVMFFDKASYYEFADTIKWFKHPVGTPNNHLVMEFQVV